MFKSQLHMPLAGYLPAKPGGAAFVSFSALPDPDRAEPQRQHAASGEERTEQRKETRYGTDSCEEIRQEERKEGCKECDRNVDGGRRR